MARALLDGGKTALANLREKTAEQAELDRLKRRVGQLERALAARRTSWRWRGNSRGTGVRVRVARSRAVVAAGYRPAVVARVAGVSRQALYRRPRAAGPGATSPDDQVIVEVARANPTDGTRMVAALASRQLGRRSTTNGCSG
jgi:hypothetical protein